LFKVARNASNPFGHTRLTRQSAADTVAKSKPGGGTYQRGLIGLVQNTLTELALGSSLAEAPVINSPTLFKPKRWITGWLVLPSERRNNFASQWCFGASQKAGVLFIGMRTHKRKPNLRNEAAELTVSQTGQKRKGSIRAKYVRFAANADIARV
jgi:hypothetical protein